MASNRGAPARSNAPFGGQGMRRPPHHRAASAAASLLRSTEPRALAASLHLAIKEYNQPCNVPGCRQSHHQQQQDLQQQQQQQQQPSQAGATPALLQPAVHDWQRIMAYPHVSQCLHCRVCIPQHILDTYAAQQRSNVAANSTAAATRVEDAAANAAAEAEAEAAAASLVGPAAAGAAGVAAQVDPTAAQHTMGHRLLTDEGPAAVTSTDKAGQQQQQQDPGRDQQPDAAETQPEPLAEVTGVTVMTAAVNNTFEWEGATYHITPSLQPHDTSLIRTCPMCRGCKHALEPMPKGITFMGSYYAHQLGASTAWLVKVATDRAPTGAAAVKLWCVPVKKHYQNGTGVCDPARIRHQIQLVLAQQETARDCGLLDIIPLAWVDRLHGVLPGSSFVADWDGLWMELAGGMSLQNLVDGGRPLTNLQALLDFMGGKLNHTQVTMAAIFDLLFSQCDRHPANVYVTPEGNLVLIDNDQAYGSSWRHCGVDSVFLPGTQKFEVTRLGFHYVMKRPWDKPVRKPRTWANAVSLLDYRCSVQGGSIGTNYPPQVARCLQKISSMTVEEVQAHYHYPSSRMAWALHQRAADMLTHGFEWTVKHGQPVNPSPARYKWAPPCCSIQAKRVRRDSGRGSQLVLQCTGPGHHASGRAPADLPAGHPASGNAWPYEWQDTGSYNLTAAEEAGQDW